MCGSESSNPADGSVPMEPLDSWISGRTLFLSYGIHRSCKGIQWLQWHTAIRRNTRLWTAQTGFLEPDKIIMLHSVCAAQSLPILRMAACHRSHRIPSQLLCRRSETMSDQTFRKKSWDGTLHCNDTVHTLDFFSSRFKRLSFVGYVMGLVCTICT